MSFAFAALRRAHAVFAIVLGCSASAIAADAVNSNAASASDVRALRQAAISAAQALSVSTGSAKALAATAASRSGAAPGEIFANPFRAYPPSCLDNGLPFRAFPQAVGDPAVQQQMLTLPGDPGACLPGGDAQECTYTEPVTVTVWRIACDNNETAVLVELDRPADKENNTTRYGTFPAVAIQQNGNTLYPARLANDPNTFYTNTLANTAVYTSDIYVLENYFNAAVQQVDYTKAFALILDTISFSLPAYDRTKYAASNLNLPISGYMTTNWFDPAHGGEGMLTQIYDNSDGATRFFTAAWYTFDPLGLPFWLYAQGTINIGDRAANSVATFYGTNGGFAGGFGSGATFKQWGTISFSFPDCNTMKFTFNGQTDASTNGPGGNGTRTWTRLSSVNGLTCR